MKDSDAHRQIEFLKISIDALNTSMERNSKRIFKLESDKNSMDPKYMYSMILALADALGYEFGLRTEAVIATKKKRKNDSLGKKIK